LKFLIHNLFSIISKIFTKKFSIYIYKRDGFIKKISYRKIKKLNIFFIKNGKIFTNSNEDAAYIKNNFILSDLSYQYRNSKNLGIKKNFIFKTGTNKFKKKYKGKIISIISGGAAKNNYGHWLFDAISRLLIILELKEIKKFDYLYVPSYKYQYQKDSLKYLNIPSNKIISSEKNKFIEGSEIICTTHPFSHRFDNLSEPIIKIVRKNFINFASLSKIKTSDRVYIERDYNGLDLSKNLSKYKDSRILINNQEIKNYLKKIGFKSFNLKYLSFSDQIKIFSKAKIIVSMYGAELSNLVFCKKGTKVLEIKNNNKLNDFKNISKRCGLKHTQINLIPLYKSNVIQNGIVKCELKQLKSALK
tara:strand:- start:53 stop:1132 length:1080 start_codon:yes stop_codon:yes gene_type:complete